VAISTVWYGLVVLGGVAKEILVSVVAAAASLLQTANIRLADAQLERLWAIKSAHELGLSIRQIAAATGVSSSRIHQVLNSGDPTQIPIWATDLRDTAEDGKKKHCERLTRAGRAADRRDVELPNDAAGLRGSRHEPSHRVAPETDGRISAAVQASEGLGFRVRAVNGLHDCAVVFVQPLRAVCEDPTAQGSEKATAARSGLDVLIRSREMLDLNERIAALEKNCWGGVNKWLTYSNVLNCLKAG
jgi:hypothetical protein